MVMHLFFIKKRIEGTFVNNFFQFCSGTFTAKVPGHWAVVEMGNNKCKLNCNLIVFPLYLLHYCYFFLLICFCNTERIYGRANKAPALRCCCFVVANTSWNHILQTWLRKKSTRAESYVIYKAKTHVNGRFNFIIL